MLRDFLRHVVAYFKPDQSRAPSSRRKRKERREQSIDLDSDSTASDYKGRYVRRKVSSRRRHEISRREGKKRTHLVRHTKHSSISSDGSSAGTGSSSSGTGSFAGIPVHKDGQVKTAPLIAAHYPWDGWPDGEFEHTFSAEELDNTKQLQVHWACVTSGLQKGATDAENWKEGRKSERRCQGIIQCDNPQCLIIVRPKVSLRSIDKQISHSCSCGGRLSRSIPPCPARQRLYKFQDGVHLIHTGTHNHSRPTHLLHLRTDEDAAFTVLVTENPKAGPLELLIGAQTLHGPGKASGDISSVLLNKDRVKYEQRKVKQMVTPGGSSGDQFLAAFADFSADHPGFVLQAIIGEVSVVSVQTAVLRSELIKDAPLTGDDENLNGIVSDAAHGFWRDKHQEKVFLI